MACIVAAIVQLGVIGLISAIVYSVGYAFGDLYEKRREAEASPTVLLGA